MPRLVALALLTLLAALTFSASATDPARVTAADLAEGYHPVVGWRHRIGEGSSFTIELPV